MAFKKKLENTTGSTINIGDAGVTIPATSFYEIPPQDYLIWSASEDVLPFISSGDLVVYFDGTALNSTDGLCYLQTGQTMLAEAVCFDNTNCATITSDNVQGAIEEICSGAAEAIRLACVTCVPCGTGYIHSNMSPLVSDDLCFYLPPEDC